MELVSDRSSNPLDLQPPCERFVPGFGEVDAHFHVVGDHPGVHGGIESGVPFTDCPAGDRLQRALVAGGLLERAGTPPVVDRTYLSYLAMCVPADSAPTADDYARQEPFFDAELRAITAHVLLPVGERPTTHVLANYTARQPDVDVDDVHATELRGSGFLVIPIADPSTWTAEAERAVVATLREVQSTDYRREADLGRFLTDGEPYFVR